MVSEEYLHFLAKVKKTILVEKSKVIRVSRISIWYQQFYKTSSFNKLFSLIEISSLKSRVRLHCLHYFQAARCTVRCSLIVALTAVCSSCISLKGVWWSSIKRFSSMSFFQQHVFQAKLLLIQNSYWPTFWTNTAIQPRSVVLSRIQNNTIKWFLAVCTCHLYHNSAFCL